MRIAYFVLLLIIAGFCVFFKIQGDHLKESLNQSKLQNTVANSMHSKLLEMVVSGFKVNKAKVDIDDYTQRLLETPSTIEPLLVFSFKEGACETCISDALTRLKEIGLKIGFNKIKIVTFFKTERDVQLFSNRVGREFEILNFEDESRFLSVNRDYDNLPAHFYMLWKDGYYSNLLFFSLNL